MIVLRLTSSLAKRMSIKLSETQEHSTSKLGDWYAVDFHLGTRQFILCTSEKGRLPIVIEGAPYKKFTERLVSDLRYVLAELGISQDQIDEELSHFSKTHFAKTKDRSVVGTMVDSVKGLEFMFEIGRLDPDNRKQMHSYLAQTPHVKLNSYPEEMTLRLFKRD